MLNNDLDFIQTPLYPWKIEILLKDHASWLSQEQQADLERVVLLNKIHKMLALEIAAAANIAERAMLQDEIRHHLEQLQLIYAQISALSPAKQEFNKLTSADQNELFSHLKIINPTQFLATLWEIQQKIFLQEVADTLTRPIAVLPNGATFTISSDAATDILASLAARPKPSDVMDKLATMAPDHPAVEARRLREQALLAQIEHPTVEDQIAVAQNVSDYFKDAEQSVLKTQLSIRKTIHDDFLSQHNVATLKAEDSNFQVNKLINIVLDRVINAPKRVGVLKAFHHADIRNKIEKTHSPHLAQERMAHVMDILENITKSGGSGNHQMDNYIHRFLHLAATQPKVTVRMGSGGYSE